MLYCSLDVLPSVRIHTLYDLVVPPTKVVSSPAVIWDAQLDIMYRLALEQHCSILRVPSFDTKKRTVHSAIVLTVGAPKLNST